MVKFRRKTDPRKPRTAKGAKGTKVAKPAKSGKTPPPPLPARSITALIGATGGVGATSTACALAIELAARAGQGRTQMQRMTDGPRVALIDMDFQTGACAHHLDLLPTLSAEDLARPPSQIDGSVLSAMTHQTVGGVALISAPNGTDVPPGPRTVLALLDAASQEFDHIVIDLPRRFEPWTPAVLAGSDTAMIVCELSVPSLHMARLRRAQMAPVLGPDGRSLYTVINKLERRAGRGSLDLADVKTALGESAFASLPYDPEPLRESVNVGEPLAVIRPDCRYLAGVRALTDALCAERAGRKPEVVAEPVENGASPVTQAA